MQSTTRNPADDTLLDCFEGHDDVELERILAGCGPAQVGWAGRPVAERAEVVGRIGRLLREQANLHAELMVREMGKPLAQAKAEVEKCAWACDHYAAEGPAQLADRRVETGATKSSIAWRPLGTLFAIMPWNFPYWQVLRAAAPNLIAGNGVLLKHAENTFGCAVAIEKLLHEAGVPRGVFRSLLIDHDQAARVIADDRVAAVTLTGSTRAGRLVGAAAGKALKKCVLELGGSDPYVVLEDADLERTASSCVTSRLINTGQSCIAAKRFIVVEPVRTRFTEMVVELMRAKRMDSPFEEGVDLGPLARRDLRDGLHRQVQASCVGDARLLLGGEVPGRPGAWYPASVLADPVPGTPAWSDELFGPVAVLIGARDENDAIRIANDTPYGLGAAVFTQDIERGERIARERLHAGSCAVNDFVKSDPRLPFGGIGWSGHGRELGESGLHEFCNMKTVVVA